MQDEKTYRIGRFELLLPADHMLESYQSRFRLYDSVLGEICRLVVAKYPDLTVIDIGANVGDTAALLCRHQDVPILCIEGNPVFATFLRRNLSHLPAGIEVAQVLVGKASGFVSAGNLKTGSGTASLDAGGATAYSRDQLRIEPLDVILSAHPRFKRSRLLKTDTDGSDFDILISSIDFIRTNLPVLYFEYDPTFRKDGVACGLEVIEQLAAAGYDKMFIYDNFGNFLEFIEWNVTDRMRDLSRFVMSHLLLGRQIYYLDVCAFSDADGDIAADLLQFHRSMIDSHIRLGGWRT